MVDRSPLVERFGIQVITWIHPNCSIRPHFELSFSRYSTHMSTVVWAYLQVDTQLWSWILNGKKLTIFWMRANTRANLIVVFSTLWHCKRLKFKAISFDNSAILSNWLNCGIILMWILLRRPKLLTASTMGEKGFNAGRH